MIKRKIFKILKFKRIDKFIINIKLKKLKTTSNNCNDILILKKYFNLLNNINNINLDKIKPFNKNIFILNLIFVKNRFFPQLEDVRNKKTIFNSSLGITTRYFSQKKNFIRSKTSYMFSSTYLRRFLVTIGDMYMFLRIRGLPLYLNDILRTLLNQTNSFYKNPFNNKILVNEKIENKHLNIRYIFFENNKNYGLLKKKKIGRIKRKISKKIILINNVLD